MARKTKQARQRKWRVVVVGDTTYEDIKARSPEEAVKKAGVEIPENWQLTTVGNAVIVSPPIKLG